MKKTRQKTRQQREVNNCSCVLCLNPRRNRFLKSKDRLTMQEKRHNEKGALG